MVNKKLLDQNINQRLPLAADSNSSGNLNAYRQPYESTLENEINSQNFKKFQPRNIPTFQSRPLTTLASGITSVQPQLANYSTQNSNRPPIPPPRINQPFNSNYGYTGNNYGYGTTSYGNNNYSYGYASPYRPFYNSYNYSPYTAYNRPYLSYSNGISPEQNGFMEEAHQSTRDAFAGIESIVTAFGSINMMIESTYHALHSSFNAVLSVIDNFSRLKNHFSQVLSTFTIIRTMQWLMRKLLYLLGLQSKDPTTEAAWRNAAHKIDATGGAESTRTSWPMFAFLVAVYAGPFIMWKFLASLLKKTKDQQADWTNPKESHFYANAVFAYKAQRPDELSINVGDYLILAPREMQKDKSWPLAFDGEKVGIVPTNYLRIGYNNIPSSSTVDKDHNTTMIATDKPAGVHSSYRPNQQDIENKDIMTNFNTDNVSSYISKDTLSDVENKNALDMSSDVDNKNLSSYISKDISSDVDNKNLSSYISKDMSSDFSKDFDNKNDPSDIFKDDEILLSDFAKEFQSLENKSDIIQSNLKVNDS